MEDMANWQAFIGKQVFISDLGAHQIAEIDGRATCVGRYAVWSPIANTEGHRVIEVSEDLAALRQKYGVPPERVLRLVHAGERGAGD
jgi:hypothetical protein